MEMENKEGLCEAEVKKNLVLVEIGEPLTLPLAVLNRSCHFKREWDRIQDKWHGKTKHKYYREYEKKYRNRPEVKAKSKEYRNRPEVKVRLKEYQNRPEVKARKKELMKMWNKKPEVIIKRRAQQRKKYWEMKENENGK